MSEKNLKKAAIGYLVGEWEEPEEGGQGVLQGADDGHVGPDTRQTDQAVKLHVPATDHYKTCVYRCGSSKAKPIKDKAISMQKFYIWFYILRFIGLNMV